MAAAALGVAAANSEDDKFNQRFLQMRGQIRHTCDRCGFQWAERTSAVMEELSEWIHHASELERELVVDYERQIRALTRSIMLLENDLTAALNDAAIAKFEAESEPSVSF